MKIGYYRKQKVRLSGSFTGWKDLCQGPVLGSQLTKGLEEGAKYKVFKLDDDSKIGERAC